MQDSNKSSHNAQPSEMDHKSDVSVSSIPGIAANRENRQCGLPASPTGQVTNNDFLFPGNAVVDAKCNLPY